MKRPYARKQYRQDLRKKVQKSSKKVEKKTSKFVYSPGTSWPLRSATPRGTSDRTTITVSEGFKGSCVNYKF